MVDRQTIDRRDVLKGLSAAGVISVAGCTGNGNGDGGDGQVVEWHAGGTGGTYFPLSNEFKNVVDSETEFSLQVQSTGASVTNVGSLNEEEADFALIQNDIAFFAKNGESLDAFEGNPVENLRGVATLYPETIHIVVRADSDIESLSDMEGKSVNTGDLGSGTQINALQILESVAGLTLLPSMSDSDSMSESARTTMWMVSGYSVATPRRFSTGLPSKASSDSPFFAKKAMSFWMSAKSASSSLRLPTFVTLAPVDCTCREKSVSLSTTFLNSLESGK